MRSYWLIVLSIALADAAIIAWLLARDGGPEELVWWAFLIVPLAVVALTAVGIAMHMIRRLF